jgi:hypothetical protein
MTDVSGNVSSYPAKSARRERTSFAAVITIGAAGAVGAQDVDDPGMVLTKNGGTGDYTLAFPLAPRGFIRALYVVSAAGTIKGVGVISFDPTAGALNFITHAGEATATNPASGDKVHVELGLDCRYP